MKESTQFKTFLMAALLAVSSVAFAQVKIGTNPTAIEGASNLEVEASTNQRKVKVNKTTGQLTIFDGTEGAGKILTSDALGGASWQFPGTLKIDQTVFIGKQTIQAVHDMWSGTQDDPKDRISMGVQPGSLTGWNASTKQYIIQESGNYRVFGGAMIKGSLPPPMATDVYLYINPWAVLQDYKGINSLTGPVLSTFWEAFIPAGTPVSLTVRVQGATQNVFIDNGFLSIIKLAY